VLASFLTRQRSTVMTWFDWINQCPRNAPLLFGRYPDITARCH